MREYVKLSSDEQLALKSVNGWVSPAPCKNNVRRLVNIEPRDLIALDIDHGNIAILEQIELGLHPLAGYEFYAHTTRSHTPDNPSLRMWIPTASAVDREQAGPVTRLVAWTFDGRGEVIEQVDVVSVRPAQMMFLPTLTKDGQWWSYRNEGELFDPEQCLREHGDWRDLSTLPRFKGENELRTRADKAENPLEKKGVVGDFCRAYDVPAAIEKFIPDVYTPGDYEGAQPRYTYTGGHSANGLVIYDDGLFAYSHHGTDPAADQNLNAFDLVRIHLFGERDKESKVEKPTELPSYKAMVEHIADDTDYKRSAASSRYDIVAMLGDVPEPESGEDDATGVEPDADEHIRTLTDQLPLLDDEDEPLSGSPVNVPKNWFPDALELDKQGAIIPNLPNASVIAQYDARLRGAIAWNDFDKRVVARRSIRSKLDIIPDIIVENERDGDSWQDWYDTTMRQLLAAPNGKGKAGYGLDRLAVQDVRGAIETAAMRNRFHPVKQYLESLKWDGTPRVETFLIRHLGCPDTPYHREVARNTLVASVARIYEPGHKFDFSPIIQGPQGVGKSTLVRFLYGDDWFGELDVRMDDKQGIAEQLSGKWGMELPELSSMQKSETNAVKAFMRRQRDDVRLAYGRNVSDLPRQCVFWGTTNDEQYLRDPTGNRSAWPIAYALDGAPIDTNAVRAERDQVWAEAYHLYREWRERHPKALGDLPLALTREASVEAVAKQEAARSEEMHEEWADRIAAWADQPLPLRKLLKEYGEVSAEFSDLDGKDELNRLVVRCAFRMDDAREHAIEIDRVSKNFQHKATMQRAKPVLERMGWHDGELDARSALNVPPPKTRRFGCLPSRWMVRIDCTEAERYHGYRFVDATLADDDVI